MSRRVTIARASIRSFRCVEGWAKHIELELVHMNDESFPWCYGALLRWPAAIAMGRSFMRSVAATLCVQSDVRYILESKHALLLCLTVLWSICFISSASEVDYARIGRGGPVSLTPKIGTLGPLKTAACWQLPDGPVEKVFVIFEPMGNVPTDFWDRSSSCAECRGLPEKRKLIIDALSRNYAVFVPRSLDEPGIWGGWPKNHPDLENAVTMLNEWKNMHSLPENVSTIGLGISSGGYAVSTLGLRPGLFEAIALMICEGTYEAFEAATQEYPPTIFVHMPKDTLTASYIKSVRRVLGRRGVLTEEARWYEHQVTPDWFAQITPVVDLALSTAIRNNLIADGLLDEKSNLLKSDSFQITWADDVKRWNILPQDGIGLTTSACIFEEMNVAFGYHWTHARNDNETFAWLDGGYQKLQKTGAATL